MEQTKTRTEQLIEELMRQLDPQSPRYHVLASARQFKSSWVDLGDKLTRVQRNKLFKEWGYQEFDEYCSKEIRIRRQTAQKLTQAYRYLEQEAPEYLGADADKRSVPDFRSVDLLRQASEEPGFAAEQYDELRRAVLEEQRSLPTVRRQFNQVVRENDPPETTIRRNLGTALLAARRFRTALESIPELAGEFPARLERFEAELARRLEECAEEATTPEQT